MNASGYWVWSAYSTEPDLAFVTQWSGLSDANAQRMLRGEKLARVPKIVVERCKHGRFVDQLGGQQGLLLVSPVLAKVLEGTVGASVQFVPVRVQSKPKLNYVAVNVLDSIPLFDRQRSTFETFEGTQVISKVSKLVLKQPPSNAPPLFHLSEEPTLILVNTRLRQDLQAASNYPGVLTPVEKYRNEY